MTLQGKSVGEPVLQVSAGDVSVEKAIDGLTSDKWIPKSVGWLPLKAGPTTLTIRVRKPPEKMELKHVKLFFLTRLAS
ncbi:hypothetical protein [Spirosoma aerolatum]|uniref:hypothetical protein n=1 Tax=Spirosoma aerolatum TaxID=1211326 RepID=UPI0009ADBD9C|nr:hypothetical protein [Spirosoma aerolatum]